MQYCKNGTPLLFPHECVCLHGPVKPCVHVCDEIFLQTFFNLCIIFPIMSYLYRNQTENKEKMLIMTKHPHKPHNLSQEFRIKSVWGSSWFSLWGQKFRRLMDTQAPLLHSLFL